VVPSDNIENTELKKQVEELKKRVDEISERKNYNFTINNNQNTININAFGREDTSGISQQVMDQCLRRTNVGLVDLVKHIHFDNASNHNVKASIEHPNIVEFHDGNEWKYDLQKKVLRQIIDSGHRMMSDHFDDHTDRLKTEMSNALFHYVCDWLRKMEKSNHAAYVDVMERVFVLVLNQSRA
jgi:hypothetical protein